MLFKSDYLLAQIQTGYSQSEYLAAYGLIVGMVVLGLLAVCIPRPRKKHFVEPAEVEEKNQKKRR